MDSTGDWRVSVVLRSYQAAAKALFAAQLPAQMSSGEVSDWLPDPDGRAALDRLSEWGMHPSLCSFFSAAAENIGMSILSLI